jgi:hypothetical protein
VENARNRIKLVMRYYRKGRIERKEYEILVVNDKNARYVAITRCDACITRLINAQLHKILKA